jgi:phage tail-like protein
MPANIENPRKQFNFTLSVPGLNPFLAQDVDIPGIEIDVVNHGDTNHDIKTGGRKKIEPIKIKKLIPAEIGDTWLFDWINRVQNEFTGGGQLPSQYKTNIIITEFSNDNQTILNRWVAEGCWPNKLSAQQLRRMASENSMEDFELQVDKITKI